VGAVNTVSTVSTAVHWHTAQLLCFEVALLVYAYCIAAHMLIHCTLRYLLQQAAGHELRGLCHYANAGVQDLHFAPTCLIDYKGFRLVCAAVLPLGPHSLVSGSPDGGRTVTPVRDPQAAKLLSLACHRLNLRSHICRGETVYSGAGKL
jgi:Clustered mitochondria